jgi:hypothetical protein
MLAVARHDKGDEAVTTQGRMNNSEPLYLKLQAYSAYAAP